MTYSYSQNGRYGLKLKERNVYRGQRVLLAPIAKDHKLASIRNLCQVTAAIVIQSVNIFNSGVNHVAQWHFLNSDTLSTIHNNRKINKIKIFSLISVTTDSTTSEDEPPPLPVKTRESSDYSNLPLPVNDSIGNGNGNYSFVRLRPLPAEPVTSYDYADPMILLENRRPPTPPPKPSRGTKYVPASS